MIQHQEAGDVSFSYGKGSPLCSTIELELDVAQLEVSSLLPWQGRVVMGGHGVFPK
jgi:hypothetical protein